MWDSRIEGDAVEFTYFSADGEAGYPGNLKAVAHYTWGEDNSLKLILTAHSGRHLTVYTTQPAVQIYTGNWLKGCPVGKGGRAYEDYDAVAIECQHCPDSPNKPDYPSTVLRPGEVFQEAIIWDFDVQ